MSTDWRDVEGYLLDREAMELGIQALRKRVLEIGSLYGKSTCLLSDYAEEVHCIDWFKGDDDLGSLHPERTFEVWKRNTEGRSNIRYRVVDTLSLSPYEMPGLFYGSPVGYHLVFVDACHREPYASHDLRLALAAIKEGGTIAVHDYTNSNFPYQEICPRIFGREPDCVLDWTAFYFNLSPRGGTIMPSEFENLVTELRTYLENFITRLRENLAPPTTTAADASTSAPQDVPETGEAAPPAPESPAADVEPSPDEEEPTSAPTPLEGPATDPSTVPTQ